MGGEGEGTDEVDAVKNVPRDIVLEEVAAQKAKVAEKWRFLEASVSKEEFERMTREYSKTSESKNVEEPNIFPSWLKARPDFQYVFPRFSLRTLEDRQLVAFAMSKEVKHRTTFDIDQTVKFMSQFKGLQHLPEPLFRQLCKLARQTTYKPGQVIHKGGDHAQVFYMVLSGTVHLLDDDGKLAEIVKPGSAFGHGALSGDLDVNHPYTAIAREGAPILARKLSKQSIQSDASESGALTSSRNGKAKLRSPKHQNQKKSKLNANAPNTFMPSVFNWVECNADAAAEHSTNHAGGTSPPSTAPPIIVLELGAQDFRATCKLYFQTKNSQLSKFLSSHVRLFSKWSKHRVNQVAPLLKEKTFSPGQVIQKSGDSAEEMYFVYRGTCTVQREISTLRLNKWPKTASQKIAFTPRGVNQVCKKSLEHEVRETKVIKSIKLAELSAGNYFGEEFLIGFDKRRTTVVASSMMQVLVIPNKHLTNMFTARMIEDMRTKHFALFTSEEAIMEKYEREFKLEQQYEHLKMSSLGPGYRKRMEEKKKTRKLQVSRSMPALPSLKKNGTKSVGSRSNATLPRASKIKQ